MNTQSED